VIITLKGQSIEFLWLAEVGSIMEIYFFRTAAGLFVGSIPVLSASMTDITSPEKRAGTIGRLSGSITAGFKVGPVLCGVLATAFSMERNFVFPSTISAVLYGLLAVAAFIALPENRARAARQAITEPPHSC
jgi:MFS family permease